MDIFIRTVYTTTKSQLCLWIWLGLFLMYPNKTRGLSDLKICGDSECEILMSRVVATKNFKAPDCRFLSFRKGDVIFVYYKLAGKRDDLWAGTRDKEFGHFPKEAVRVDEIHVSKEKEKTLPTERHDFFCMDEHGAVVEIDDTEEYKEWHPENEEIMSKEEELHGTSENTDKFQTSASNNKDTDQTGALSHEVPSEATAQGGSSWIGSVTGWFSPPDRNNGDSDNSDDNLSEGDEKQDTFRKRKLALDDGQLEEKSTMFGWIGGELTNVLGYGERQAEKNAATIQKADGERQPREEKPAEEQELTSGQHSSWLNMGIGDILKFGGGETVETDKAIELSQGLDSAILPEEKRERGDSQPSDKDGEKELEEALSSDFISKGPDTSEPHMPTDNQPKQNEDNLEARSDELTADGKSSDQTALDDEQLVEKSSMFGWIRGEPTHFLGYGEKQAEKDTASTQKTDGERQPGEEKPAEEQEPASGENGSGLNMGIGDVLKFGGGETAETDKGIKLSQGPAILPEGEQTESKHAPDSMKEIQETHTTETATDSVITEGNVGSLENHHESLIGMQKGDLTDEADEKAEVDDRSSVLNSIAGEKTKEVNSENGMPLSKIEDPEHIPAAETTQIRDKAESLFPSDGLSSAFRNVSSQSKADTVNDRDEIQSKESEKSEEHLVIDDFSSEGQKMSLDNDEDRKHLIEDVSDTDNQKTLSEERDVLFMPSDSQAEYNKDRGNVEAPTIRKTEPEEKADPNVMYENKDETSEVFPTEKELQKSDEKSSSDITDSSGQPYASDDPLHDSMMSEGTTANISDITEQTDVVSAVTNTEEATSNQHGSTQFRENTDTLSDEFLALDKASSEMDNTFEMDNTSDTEVATLDQASAYSEEVSEPEDEKDIIDRNTQKYSDDITSFDESTINSDKESITDCQHTNAEKPEQSQESVLPEDSTEIEREDSQSSDKDGEREQEETLSSDYISKDTYVSEPYMTADNQPKQNDESLEARSDELTVDVTSSDQTKEKEDTGAQEKFNIFNDADLLVVNKQNDAQQKLPNESLTELNTEGINSLSRESAEDVANQNSFGEGSLEGVDSISSESIIDDPDSVILNTETGTDFSKAKIAEMLKEDETESETVDTSGNSDTPTQNFEHQSELYMEHEKDKFQSDTYEDNTLSPEETLSEDTHIALGLPLDSYVSETVNVTSSTHSETITEEQQTQKSEFGVTESGQIDVKEKHKDSETDLDSPTTLMNGHLDSVKRGKDDNDIHLLHRQSTEHIPMDSLIREEEKQTGWYDNVYDRVIGLYGGRTQPDDTGDAVNPSDSTETRTPEGFPNDEGKMGTQSLFSVGGLSSVFESFTSKPQTDTPDQTKDQPNEASSSEKSNTGLECLHTPCTTLTENEKVTFKDDGEIAREVQDPTHFMDEGKNVKEDVSYITAQAESGSMENFSSHEDPAVLDHDGPTIRDHYEFKNDEITLGSPTEGSYKPVTTTDIGEGQTVELVNWFLTVVVSSLPDDLRPGPDLYGLPWEAVIFTAVLGLCIILLFSCRFYLSVKSRLYARRERKLAQKVAEAIDEKCKVLQELSEAQKEYDRIKAVAQNGGLLADVEEKQKLESMTRQLQESNAQMEKDVDRLTERLNAQKEKRMKEEQQLAQLQETVKSLEDEAKDLKSQLEQATTTLKIHNMNSERLQKKLQASREESVLLRESNEQLSQETEGWAERLAELEDEMKMCESSHLRMLEDCANKDERIKSLTECLLKMKDWDSDLEDKANDDGSPAAMATENGDETDHHQKHKIQKLISAAKLNADLRSLEEDKNRVVAKLSDEIKAKEDLLEGIAQLEEQKEQLKAESSKFSSESQKLQQKLTIMTEMYHENELKLHRMLTVEEKERLQKEEKLTKADMKITLAAEELNNYKVRAEDLAEEMDKTNQAYKNQIAAHEKKAHDNWLAARAAERDLADIKRENAHLRQKLTDYQFKMEVLEKDPYALDAPGRPLFRGERSPYGPSPLGRPASETRAFLSPPTLMDGPPRLSPQFAIGPGGRVSRGLVEPPGAGGDLERSGGPHSDSGSISPSCERERRGPPGPLPPPGHPYPEPGLPFRRPPPAAFPMGPLPPRPPFPPEGLPLHGFGPSPGPHPAPSNKPDSSFAGNSTGISEAESRDASLMSAPGDVRMPPDTEMRMGPPGMGPQPPALDPRDPHFQRRGPYGPPDFFPPRGPGGIPLGMRGPPPPGMFPRYPPPPHMGYPPVRPPLDGFPPGPPGPPPRPSPPGSEQPPDQTPPPQDAI